MAKFFSAALFTTLLLGGVVAAVAAMRAFGAGVRRTPVARQ